jgi:hypothetical protein
MMIFKAGSRYFAASSVIANACRSDYDQVMAISFQCPQGHKLSCSEERAGLKGKCPKCGSIFQVPQLVPPTDEPHGDTDGSAAGGDGDSFLRSLGGGTELTSSESGTAIGKRPESEQYADFTGTGDSGTLAPAHDEPAEEPIAEPAHEPADIEPAAPEPVEETAREESIMFLCPSGHKLNAPKSLQGKPGKCPHCGEKFLVPVLEELAEAEEADDFLASLSDAPPANEQTPAESTETPPETLATGSGFFAGLAQEDEFAMGMAESSSQAMALLFSRLWADRGETGVLELYLKGGEILTPRWYAPQLSQNTYGMFAFIDADGSHTLTAVQWDAIERIALRGMQSLPDGVFEE